MAETTTATSKPTAAAKPKPKPKPKKRRALPKAKPHRFPSEFKAQVIADCADGLSQADASRRYGISESLVSSWVTAARAATPQAQQTRLLPPAPAPSEELVRLRAEVAELHRLRAEVERLRADHLRLRKVLAVLLD